MSTYIGKLQIGTNEELMPIGSTLFGVCNSAINSIAKTATLSAFDTLIHGVTIHIRFNYGNSVTSGLTLAVGESSAYPITGNCVCNANSVVEFTFDEVDGTNKFWRVNGIIPEAATTTPSNIGTATIGSSNRYAREDHTHGITLDTGDNNGQIKIAGQNISVNGLKSAAYTESTDYATSAQGIKADEAMPKSGGTFTGNVSFDSNTILSINTPIENTHAATKKYVDDIFSSAMANIASTAYGVCETLANNPRKEVEITGFELIPGVTIHVKFTYANSASNPTLAVKYGIGANEITAAKQIMQYGTTSITDAISITGWPANTVISLTYDGTYWIRDYDTWQPLSISQAGYVNIAPNDTTKFLRGDASWELLPTASSNIAGITTVGVSGGAAAYDHGVHVTQSTVLEVLGANNTHNDQFLRKDGTWQTVSGGVSRVATLTGDIGAAELVQQLGLSKALRFVGKTTSNMTNFTGVPTGITNYSTPAIGDVVLDSDNDSEYVCVAINGSTYIWELLGRSGSWATADHEHSVSITTGTNQDNNQLTLDFNTKYKLTVGSNSYIFSTPVNPNTDIAVNQRVNSTDANYSLLFSYYTIGTVDNTTANEIYRIDNVYVNPSTGIITASGFHGNATTATAWATSRTIYVDLTSTATNTTINGSATDTSDIVLGISGVLDIAHGGTYNNSVNNYGVVYGNSDGSAYTSTSAPTEGQVLIGHGTTSSNVTPSWYSGLLLTGNGNNSYNAAFAGNVSIDGTLTVTDHVGIGDVSNANYQLYINGNSLINGNLIPTLSTDSTPAPINTLGSSTNRWAALYIGSPNKYGDEYTPIYWHNGAPDIVTPQQRINFTFTTSNSSSLSFQHNAIELNTWVNEIVITDGFSYLNSEIEWSVTNSNDIPTLTLTASTSLSGNKTITGYILISHTAELNVSNI